MVRADKERGGSAGVHRWKAQWHADDDEVIVGGVVPLVDCNVHLWDQTLVALALGAAVDIAVGPALSLRRCGAKCFVT